MGEGQAAALLCASAAPLPSAAQGTSVAGFCAESGGQVDAPSMDFAGLILELLGGETSSGEAVPSEVVEDKPEDRSPAEDIVALPDLRALQPPLLQQAAPAPAAPETTASQSRTQEPARPSEMLVTSGPLAAQPILSVAQQAFAAVPQVLPASGDRARLASPVVPPAPSALPGARQVTPAVEGSTPLTTPGQLSVPVSALWGREVEGQQTAPVTSLPGQERTAVPLVASGAETVPAVGAAQVEVSATRPPVQETGVPSGEFPAAAQRPTVVEGPQRFAGWPDSAQGPLPPAATMTVPAHVPEQAEVVPTTPAAPVAPKPSVAVPEIVTTPSPAPEATPTAPVTQTIVQVTATVARDARPTPEGSEANLTDQTRRTTVQASPSVPERTLETPQATVTPSAVRVARAPATTLPATQAIGTVPRADAPRPVAGDQAQVTASLEPEAPALQATGRAQETATPATREIATSAPQLAEAARGEGSSVASRLAERVATGVLLQTPEVGGQLPRSQNPLRAAGETVLEGPQGVALPVPPAAPAVTSPQAQQALMASQSLAAEETVATKEAAGGSAARLTAASGLTQKRVAASENETAPMTMGTVSAPTAEVGAERVVTPVEATQRAVQLAEAIHSQVGLRGGRVKLYLPWDDLGVESVTVVVADRHAGVDLVCSEAQALDLRVLEGPLRERLQAHGLTLEAFTMSFGEGQSSGGQSRSEYVPTSPSPLGEEPRSRPSAPRPQTVYSERSSSGVLDLFA
ncbi:MAG: hypothetical protein ABFE16_18445 [Armatimonadia bacterium]